MKKILININGGVGDAVLWLPLCKQLIDQGYEVNCCTSTPSIKQLLECFNLFKKIHLIGGFNLDFYKISQNNDYIYLDLWPNLYVFINCFFIHKEKLRILNNCQNKYVSVLKFLRFSEFNIANMTGHMLNILSMYMGLDLIENYIIKSDSKKLIDHIKPKEKYIVVQIYSGDATDSPKNLNINFWIEVFRHVLTNHGSYTLLLLGGEGRELAANISNHPKIINLIEKTDLDEVVYLIDGCSGYIGLDSGLMHVAALLGKPTVSFWGPSSEAVYGYSQFDSEMHHTLRCEKNCSPCQSPTIKNSVRYSDPFDCGDRRCTNNFVMSDFIKPLSVFFEKVEQ